MDGARSAFLASTSAPVYCKSFQSNKNQLPLTCAGQGDELIKGVQGAEDGRLVTIVLDREPAGFEDLLGFGQSQGGRAYQEDDMRIVYGGADTDVLMILADGMGGHQGGAVASRLAVETFAEAFVAAEGSVAARLRASLDAANAAVGRRADDDAGCWGMGCTLVACVVTPYESAHWISVGDSPLWLLRGREDGNDAAMERLNDDHSMKPVLEDLAKLGRISAEEVASGSHQLRSAVMGDALAMVDAGGSNRLAKGDRLLLASDGLETLPETEIARVCQLEGTAATAVSILLDAIDEAARPGQDNVTVILYEHARSRAVPDRHERLTANTMPKQLVDGSDRRKRRAEVQR